MGAAFLSADGYHHHIGINTWNSLDGESHTHGNVGLEYFTVIVPDRSSFNTIQSNIHDPVSSEQQEKQRLDKNQFLVFDPDGIQFVIKSE
jgi:catechol 2,3-dioxygenase